MSATTTVSSTAARHQQEVSAGDRFEFGKNWQAFLSSVDEPRIRAAEASLLSMLRCHDLTGRTFLDIGCGSGLFSLAARRQGAGACTPSTSTRQRRVRARAQAPLPRRRRRMDNRAGIGPGPRLHGGARTMGHRLLLGSAAPHRRMWRALEPQAPG